MTATGGEFQNLQDTEVSADALCPFGEAANFYGKLHVTVIGYM